MYSIYLHTFPDGKKYVGSTSKDVENRWRLGWGYKNNKEMFKAIKYVGWENIQHQVIDTAEDKETAIKLEEFYTLLFRSSEPEFGYNKLAGSIQTEYNKKRISKKVIEFFKNKELSSDVLKNISESARRPVRLKNINTGEIIEFDSRKKCAEFFGVCTHTLNNFIKCNVQISKTFKDYKVLKTVKK